MNELIKLSKNKQIKAVAPHFDGTHSSIVLTHQGRLYMKGRVEEVMDQLCRYYGSTLEGRKNATRDKLNVRKNPPIVVSEILQLYAFELPYFQQPESIWIFDFQYEIDPLNNGCQLRYGEGDPIYIPLLENTVNNRKQKAIQMIHEFIHVIKNK